MTLEEFIQHYEELLRTRTLEEWGSEECYNEHKQLLGFLKELRASRQVIAECKELLRKGAEDLKEYRKTKAEEKDHFNSCKDCVFRKENADKISVHCEQGNRYVLAYQYDRNHCPLFKNKNSTIGEIKEQFLDKKKDFSAGDKVWIRKDLDSPYAETGFITEAGETQSRVFFSYSNKEEVLDNRLLIKA